MIIIWKGLGVVVPIIPLIIIATMDKMMPGSSFAVTLGFLLSGGALYFLGKKLNEFESSHSFFFIPMQYWGYPLMIGGVVSIFQ